MLTASPADNGPEQAGHDLCHTRTGSLKILFIFHERLEAVSVLPHERDSVLSGHHVVFTSSLHNILVEGWATTDDA